MTRAVVITANYGGHDLLPRPPVEQRGIDVDWHYYTDSTALAPPPWRTMIVEPWHPDPNLAAKLYKTMPPPLRTGDVVWVDANMEITSPEFVRQALAARRDGVAVWRHPRRSCIYTEAEASIGAEAQGGKYDPDRIKAQVAAYLDEGYPAQNGLYACGTVAWDLLDKRAHDLGLVWLNECVQRSPQDQLSFPVACWRLGITPGVFPPDQIERRYSSRQFIGNRWLRIWPHAQKVSRAR